MDKKRKEKGRQIIPYFYFLIIKFEEYKTNFESILMLTYFTGITFLVFLYIESDKIIFYKPSFNFIFPAIFVYSPEDILYYLSQKLKFEHPSAISEKGVSLQKRTEKYY